MVDWRLIPLLRIAGIDEIGGNLSSGRPGIALDTIPAFLGMVPEVYNKVTARLLGAPLLAANLDWVTFLDGRMGAIGGITSGLRKSNPQKGAEPHMFYLFKAKSGRTVFQYKTRHDLVMNNDWQGGDDGIPLFAPDAPEPDLRNERPTLTGLDEKYMALGKDGKTKKSGTGRTLPGELIAHLKREGCYSSDVTAEWEKWFTHAWPRSVAEHEQFVASLADGSNPLAAHFHVPDADPARLVDRAEFSTGPQLSDRLALNLLLPDEVKPIEIVTHPAWTEKEMRAAVKQRARAEDGDLYALQPASIPPKVPGMRIYIYNLYVDDKRELTGQWVSAELIRPSFRGEKRVQKSGGKLQLIPVGWWVCRYFDGEELAFRLGDKDFKTKGAGNGWVLDALYDDQPEEIVPFCKVAHEARERNQARRRGRRRGESKDRCHVGGNIMTRVSPSCSQLILMKTWQTAMAVSPRKRMRQMTTTTKMTTRTRMTTRRTMSTTAEDGMRVIGAVKGGMPATLSSLSTSDRNANFEDE